MINGTGSEMSSDMGSDEGVVISQMLEESSLKLLELDEVELEYRLINVLEQIPEEWVYGLGSSSIGFAARRFGFLWKTETDFRVVMTTLSFSGVIEHDGDMIRRGVTPVSILVKSLLAQLSGVESSPLQH